jgi:hypothetical protein
MSRWQVITHEELNVMCMGLQSVLSHDLNWVWNCYSLNKFEEVFFIVVLCLFEIMQILACVIVQRDTLEVFHNISFVAYEFEFLTAHSKASPFERQMKNYIFCTIFKCDIYFLKREMHKNWELQNFFMTRCHVSFASRNS